MNTKIQETQKNIPQILKSSIIEEGTPGQITSIKARFKNAVRNNRKFNRGICTFKKGMSANSESLYIYNNNNLVREIYYVIDRNGIEFGYVDYKRTV